MTKENLNDTTEQLTIEELQDPKELQKRIFAGLFNDDIAIESENRFIFFKSFVQATYFRDEYFALMLVFLKLGSTIQGIDENVIQGVLATQKTELLASRNIDFSIYGGEEGFFQFIEKVAQEFKEIKELKVSQDGFKSYIEIYKMYYIKSETIAVLERASNKLYEPLHSIDRGKKPIDYLNANYTEARKTLMDGIQRVDTLVTKVERKGLINLSDMSENIEHEGIRVICKYGIEKLDAVAGGVLEGQMVSLLAPPKGGKSRSATFFLHQAIIQGQNVLMWSVENGPKGWEALLRARHFQYLYTEKDTELRVDPTIVAQLHDGMILQNNFPENTELRELEAKSWVNLRTGEGYGKVYIIDEDLDADTAVETLEKYIDETDANIVCVDYLQLISGDSKTPKHQRIGDVYSKMLQLMKRKKVAGFFPGQIKQTGVDVLRRMQKTDAGITDFRDIAGESAEVVRTPDVNLLLAATIEDLQNNKMQIINMMSRNMPAFDPIDITLELGRCTLTQAEEEEYY